MGQADLRKYLKTLDKNQIIELVSDLYKKQKTVKEYFDFFINPNEKELFEKYKEKIDLAFFPKRGFIQNLSQAKKAISEFKKFEPSPELVADLMLFYVETGVRQVTEYGDERESFYTSMEKTYFNALTLMYKENLLEKFSGRAAKVVSETENLGWGFGDMIGDIHSEFY